MIPAITASEPATMAQLAVTAASGRCSRLMTTSVAQASDSPIKLIGVGEAIDDLQPFDAHAFARSLVGLEEPVR